MQADVPTLMATILLASLTMASVMVVVGWGARGEGLQLWAAGLAMHAAGYLFLALRGHINEALSVLAGNAFTSLALSLLLAAVLRFYGHAPRWALIGAPPALLLAMLSLLLDDYAARVTVSGAVYASQASAIAVVLCARRRTTVGRGVWLVTAGMGAAALLMGLRAGGSAFSTQAASQQAVQLLQPGAVQTATFLGTFAVLLITSLGFIFMTKERADESNRVLAASDALTGIANRRSIIAALDRDVGRAIRNRTPLALMMIDLDHFKRVNDNFGHLAGDAVLRGLVEVVHQRIRSQDMVGRYGGEEFLVVLPETTLIGARRLATELCQAVAAHGFAYEGRTIPLTISIGVFGGLLEPGDSWDALIDAADSALYDAKRAGRNRVEETPVLPRALQDGAPPETFPASLS